MADKENTSPVTAAPAQASQPTIYQQLQARSNAFKGNATYQNIKSGNYDKIITPKKVQGAIDKAKEDGSWQSIKFDYSSNNENYGAHRSADMAHYLNEAMGGSLQSDQGTTDSFLQEANSYLNYHTKHGNKDSAEYWANMVAHLDRLRSADFYNDNRGKYQELGAQKTELEEKVKQAKATKDGFQKAASVGVGPNSPVYKDYINALNEYNDLNGQLNNITTQMSALDNDFWEFFATDEEKEARSLLESGASSKLGRAFSHPIVYGQAVNMPKDAQALMDKAATDAEKAQQIVDNFWLNAGSAPQYYNFLDREAGGFESGLLGVGSSVVGAAGTALKLTNEAGVQQAKLTWEQQNGRGSWDQMIADQKAQAAANPTMIGGEVVPTSDSELAPANLLAKAKQEEELNAFNGVTTPSQARVQANREASRWTRVGDILGAEIIQLQAELDDMGKAPDSLDSSAVYAYASRKDEIQAQIKQKEKEQKTARDLAAQYGGARASLGYALNYGTADDAVHVIDQISWELGDKANMELAKATKNAKPIEKAIVHMTKTGVEMGFDAAVGAMTGAGGLPVMFTRVFGQASQEANRAGASLPKQVLYGATVAGIEVFTEKMADLGGGLIYGKSFTGDFTKRLIHNLELSPVWEMVMYGIADTFGEALEEGAADILGGLAEMIIRRNPDKGFWEDFYDLTAEQCADIWYDMLLGGLMGMLGAGGGAITGQYAQENADLYASEFIGDIDAEARQAEIDQSRLREAQKYGTPEEVAAIQAEIDSGANAPRQSAITQAYNKAHELTEKYPDGNVPVEERLTKAEFNMLKSIGLVEESMRESLTKPSDRVMSKAAKLVDDSVKKAKGRREKIIAGAEIEGVGQVAPSDENSQAASTTRATVTQEYIDKAKSPDLNKMWKNKQLTTGQYADAMVKNGFWSEQMANSFIETARARGASEGELKRNVPIEAETPVASEGTSAPAAEEKTVKPAVEATEQSVTTQQENGIIGEQKGANNNEQGKQPIPGNDGRGDSGADSLGGPVGTAQGGIQSNNSGSENAGGSEVERSSQEKISSRINSITGQEATEDQIKAFSDALSSLDIDGNSIVSEDDLSPGAKMFEQRFRKAFGSALTFAKENPNSSKHGINFRYVPELGVIVTTKGTSGGRFGSDVVHEGVHNVFRRLVGTDDNHISWQAINNLRSSSEYSGEIDKAFYRVSIICSNYAADIVGENNPDVEKLKKAQTTEEAKAALDSMFKNDEAGKNRFEARVNEEMYNDLVAGLNSRTRLSNPDAAIKYVREHFSGVSNISAKDIGALVSLGNRIGNFYAANNVTVEQNNQPSKANASVKNDSFDALEEAPSSEESQSRAQPSGIRSKSKSDITQKTQTKTAINDMNERIKEISDKYGTEDGTFLSRTRDEVSRIARHWIEKYGFQKEYDRLLASKEWSRVDFSEAGKIIYDMTVQLNRDMTAKGNHGLPDYEARRDAIDALLAHYTDQKSEAGQKLQEQYKFSLADEIRMMASQRFLSYTKGSGGNAKAGEVLGTEYSINSRMWAIMDDLLNRAEAAEASGSMIQMKELIKMVARIRSRQSMFGRAGVKAENFMLDRMIKQGVTTEQLSSLMFGNIGKIMDDLTPITYADAIQSVRMTNMLSNVATGLNNFINNAGALRTQSIAQNASIPFAKAFERITGKKVAVRDYSFFRARKNIRRAEEVAFEYALLSAYYGMNGEEGRFDKKSHSSGFSMLDGGVGKALARYNFLVNAFVLAPDAPAKARVEAGIGMGIEKAFADADMNNPETAKNVHELEAYAKHEAKRRTLQDENKYTNMVQYVKRHLLNANTPGANVEIKGRKLGSLNLGDFMIAFAKVPTNVGVQKIAATPYGSLYHVIRYAQGLAKAKLDPESMSVTEMAKLSRDVGRAATTWGMIGLGALAAMCGALKNFDDTDDDEEKRLAREKGYSGLMFNPYAIFHGGEWREDDPIISANFLEILALPLSIGAMMYDASKEGMGTLDAINYGTKKGLTGMIDAIMDIPGLQQVGDLYQSFANRNPDDDDFNAILKGLGQYATSTSTSYFIPNAFSQAVSGWDNTQRDIYGTDSYGETLRNIYWAKLPGLRQKLPEKTDTFGNVKTYGDDRISAIINTVFLPGDVRKYHVSELEKEMLRLKDATDYKGTIFDTNAPRSIEYDEQDYALNAEQRRAYHDTKAKYLTKAYDALITSDYYQSLNDNQRLAVIKQLRTDAERMVKNECLVEAGIADKETLNAGLDAWERKLTTWDQKVQYLSVKQMAGMYWDKGENSVTDFAGMDKFIAGDYKNLSDEQKKILNGSFSHLDDLADAAKSGINSEKWQTAYNIYQTYTVEDENGNRVFKADLKNESEMWSKIQKATGFSDGGKEMKYLQGHMKLTFTGSPNTETYDELIYDYGLSRESASKIYGNFSKIEPTKGYANVQDRQKWVGLTQCGLPDKEQWDSFFAMVPSNNTNQIKNMQKLRGQVNPKTGKVYTFAEAIHKLELDVIYWKEVLPNGKEKKHRLN